MDEFSRNRGTPVDVERDLGLTRAYSFQGGPSGGTVAFGYGASVLFGGKRGHWTFGSQAARNPGTSLRRAIRAHAAPQWDVGLSWSRCGLKLTCDRLSLTPRLVATGQSRPEDIAVRSSPSRVIYLMLAIALSATLMQACETEPTVRSQFDKTADFGAYRTFNFVSPLATDKLGYATLVTQTLKSAVTQEMQNRGYQLSDNPDLLVDFSARLEQKQEIRSTPSAGPYGYYGYRSGLYSPWRSYSYSQVYTRNYKEGTINVDLIDAKKKQMVWEGVGIGEVSETKMEDRDQAITNAVGKIFAKYPFRAGSAQPVGESQGESQ